MTRTRQVLLMLLPFALPAYVVRFKIGPFPTTLLEVIVLVLFIIWLAGRAPKTNRDLLAFFSRLVSSVSPSLLLAMLAWIAAGAIGILVAPDHIAALGLWRAYFLEPALVFIMALDIMADRSAAAVILRSLAIMCGLLGIWAIVQYFSPAHWTLPAPWNVPPNGIRATGPYSYPNALALFSVPIAALCFFLWRGNLSAVQMDPRLRGDDKIDRCILCFGFLGGLAATILAKSDGGLIALIAACAVTLLINKKTQLVALALGLVVTAGILAYSPTRNVVYRQVFFKEWSGKVRLVTWGETWKMLRDRPLTGAGLGAYRDVIKPYHKATWMEIFMYPHNIGFNLWSETGLLGLGAFIAILILWIRRAGLIALPVVTTIVVHGLVDVPYFKNDLAIVLWLLIALTLSLKRNPVG